MKPERAKLLAELLREMRAADGDFIPPDAWLAVHEAFSLPYIELFIVRRAADGALEFLLTYRDDEHWKGWHIPGGLWRTSQTAAAACDALLKSELGLSTGVEILSKGMWEKWLDHPYAHAISHVCICRSTAEIPESETVKWFREVPDGMIADGGHDYHIAFITDSLTRIKVQGLL